MSPEEWLNEKARQRDLSEMLAGWRRMKPALEALLALHLAEVKPEKFERIPAFELTPDEADKVSGSVGAALAIEARKGKGQ